MAECVFCGEDRKLTREHVWPAWLVKLVPPPDPSAPYMKKQGTYETFSGMLAVPEFSQGVRSNDWS